MLSDFHNTVIMAKIIHEYDIIAINLLKCKKILLSVKCIFFHVYYYKYRCIVNINII